MRAKFVYEVLNEGYGMGAGLSYGGGIRGMSGSFTRGAYGGASNLGGPNMMYTYEIKPLSHTLETRPTISNEQVEQIQIGSKISGYPIQSNITPIKKRVTGIVTKIVKTDNNALKYYVIQDEATQNKVKLEPLSVKLIIAEPIKYYYDATNNIPNRKYGKRVKETLR